MKVQLSPLANNIMEISLMSSNTIAPNHGCQMMSQQEREMKCSNDNSQKIMNAQMIKKTSFLK
jgi:hypothetical protein